MMPSIRRARKEPGNFRLISLTLVLGKVMEQIILSAITLMYRTSRSSHSVSMGWGLRKARPARLKWSPSVARLLV